VIAGSRPGRPACAASVLLLAFGVILGACSPAATSSPPPSAPSPSSTPAPAAPSASEAALPSTLVPIDPALLDLLPDSVGGRPLEESPETAAGSASEPALARTAEGIAVAVAVDPATDNFLVASVVELKPGIFGDEFFRDWRDSFDEAVCAQAGGVGGNAQAEIDGRTVYIGTCSGGSHTYHVHLEQRDVILSVNAVGDAKFGEQLVENLPD
jgi:hypothetical protein